MAYDFDMNDIFPIPIKDVTDASIIEAFQKVFEELKEKGQKLRSMSQTTRLRGHSKNTCKPKNVDGNLWSPATTE